MEQPGQPCIVNTIVRHQFGNVVAMWLFGWGGGMEELVPEPCKG